MENWAKWADGARGGGGMLRDSTFLFSHLTNKTVPWHTHPHSPQRHKRMHAPPPLYTTRLLPPSPPHVGLHRFPSAVPLDLTAHNYPTKTQDAGKSSEYDWTQQRILGNELPHVGRLYSGGPYVGMNMHVNLSHRKWTPSKMPKVSSVRSEVLAPCWAFGGMQDCV